MGYFVKNRQIQSGSTAVQIPVGDGTNRPDAPVFGMIRYNTSLGYCEFYNGTAWQTFGTGGIVNYTVQNDLAGDGSSTQIGPLTQTVASADQIQVFVGSIYQVPYNGTAGTYNYDINVAGTYLEFQAPPPNGIPITVIFTSN